MKLSFANAVPLHTSLSSRRRIRNFAALLSLACASVVNAATIGWNQTGSGTFDYNDPANWVDGGINGNWDASLLLTAGQTTTFAADTLLPDGLAFHYDGGFNVTLRGTGGDRTITLGGDITVNTVSNTRTITIGAGSGQNLNVDLGGTTRTFTVGSGRSLGFVNALSNGSVVTHGGSVNFSGANTYTGTTTVNAGNFSLNGAAGSVAASDVTVRANTSNTSTLIFNSSTSGVTGTLRAGSVTLRGAGASNGVALSVTGNSTANSVDSILGQLHSASGFSTITVSANAARNARLDAGSFTRSPGTTVLFRGGNLGLSPIASQSAGQANIQLGSSPALSGGSGTSGQSTVPILKGAYGDTVSNGSGSGLVTYDAIHGVRLLDPASEYAATIADGQTQLDNVRIVRATGDASQNVHLASPTTTINSLVFGVSGAGTDTGITVSGDPDTTLRLSSGVIFARQTLTTATVSDAMVVSVPTLDLNGGEGVFIAFTNGISNSNTPAPLQINSSITNDGGNGVTIGGTGQVVFGGSAAHGYTGVTTLNSGILRLNKSVANIGIPGDLVMNGGTLLKTSNAIPDTASVTINAGTFWFDSTSSSGNNNHTETLHNFTLNGGGAGHHGSNATLNINGDATVNVNDLAMNQGGDVTVLGTTTLNGGRLVARESSSSSVQNAIASLNHLVIHNTPATAYTAVMVNAHGTNRGARVVLNGNLTFTGNATNANTVRIDSSDTALANQGVIALNGTRTFAIGNGAAAVDLSITPELSDNGGIAGGLTKTGAGTLALLGTTSFTGPTEVQEGTLHVGGSISGTSSLLVGATGTLTTDDAATIAPAPMGGVLINGTLAPGGDGAHGIATLELTTGGILNFGNGAVLALDLHADPANADRVRFGAADDWLGGTGEAILQLGGSVDYGATYTVFENVTTPDFAFLAIEGYDTLNYSAELQQVGFDYQLTFTAIPEPAIGGLLLGGLSVLAATRRRHGRSTHSSSL